MFMSRSFHYIFYFPILVDIFSICVNYQNLLFILIICMYSLYLICSIHPVSPMNTFLQSRHIDLYIPVVFHLSVTGVYVTWSRFLTVLLNFSFTQRWLQRVQSSGICSLVRVNQHFGAMYFPPSWLKSKPSMILAWNR
jgi:hypothetical protein